MRKEILKGSIMILAGAALVLSSRAYDAYQAGLARMQTEMIEECNISVVAHGAYLNWASPVTEEPVVTDVTLTPVQTETEMNLQEANQPELAQTTEETTAVQEEAVREQPETAETSAPLVTGEDRTLYGFTTGVIMIDNEIRKMLDAKIPTGMEDLENKAVSYVNGLHVRAQADCESDILGTLQEGEVVTVLETGDEWTRIASARCEGYVANEYLCTELSALFYIAENYDYVVVPNVSSVRVRAQKSTDSEILKTVNRRTQLGMIDADEEWVTVRLADGKTGYVAAEYVDAGWNYKADVTQEQQSGDAEPTKTVDAETTKREEKKQTPDKTAEKKETKSKDKKTQKGEVSGQDVVDYAMQFVGNPYKAGGTSLTKGADCSGFTQSVYKHFGYSLSRSSSGQRADGKKVSMDKIQAGDVICYSGHVAIYIGGGKIVHASTPKGGIKVGNLNYAKPICARRIIQ